MQNIKNAKFRIIESTDPTFTIVSATCNYQGKKCRDFILVKKHAGLKEDDYLKIAKEKFLEKAKDNQIKPVGGAFTLNKKTIVIMSASLVGAIGLATGGYFTYKAIKANLDAPKTYSVKFDKETNKLMNIKPAVIKKDTDYTGTITLKNANEGLRLSTVRVYMDDKELEPNIDYTININPTSSGDPHQYSLNIPAREIIGKLSIHASTGDISKFKIDETAYQNLVANSYVINSKITSATPDYSVYTSPIHSNINTGGVVPYIVGGDNGSVQYHNISYNENTAHTISSVNKLDLVDVYYAREDSSSTQRQIYSKNNQTTKMYSYVEENTYINEDIDYFDPTKSNPSFGAFDGIINNVSLDDILFDEITLSYENKKTIVGSTNNFTYHKISLSCYDGKLEGFYCYSDNLGEGSISTNYAEETVQANFFYDIDEIVLPSKSECYDAEANPKVVSADDQWDKLLTLNSTSNPNMSCSMETVMIYEPQPIPPYINNAQSSASSFVPTRSNIFYDENKIAVFNKTAYTPIPVPSFYSTSYTGNIVYNVGSVINYYDKENDICFCYHHEGLLKYNGGWSKTTSSLVEEDYNRLAFENVLAKPLKTIRANKNKFTFVAPQGDVEEPAGYIASNLLDYVSVLVSFNEYTSLDGKNKETVLDSITLYNSDEDYIKLGNFASNYNINIVLPTV